MKDEKYNKQQKSIFFRSVNFSLHFGRRNSSYEKSAFLDYRPDCFHHPHLWTSNKRANLLHPIQAQEGRGHRPPFPLQHHLQPDHSPTNFGILHVQVRV